MPLGGEDLVQRVHDGRFPAVDTQRERLNHEVIVEFVDHEGGQLVRFAKHETAVFHVADLFAVIPGFLQPVKKKGFVDLFLAVAGE